MPIAAFFSAEAFWLRTRISWRATSQPRTTQPPPTPPPKSSSGKSQIGLGQPRLFPAYPCGIHGFGDEFCDLWGSCPLPNYPHNFQSFREDLFSVLFLHQSPSCLRAGGQDVELDWKRKQNMLLPRIHFPEFMTALTNDQSLSFSFRLHNFAPIVLGNYGTDLRPIRP